MTIKLIRLLLAAVVISQASARFCIEQGEHTCDETKCEMEFFGVSNGRRLQNIVWYNFHIVGAPGEFLCSYNGDWCLHTRSMRVKACNQESALDDNLCANIC
ncbi:MAG: hypothetical protein J3R72DRAFT_473663 [Linnemannia gamsii]|nr:MAG: hypothetical protein J3R72DRAFT_473663 [Linnemannia gamsii]